MSPAGNDDASHVLAHWVTRFTTWFLDHREQEIQEAADFRRRRRYFVRYFWPRRDDLVNEVFLVLRDAPTPVERYLVLGNLSGKEAFDLICCAIDRIFQSKWSRSDILARGRRSSTPPEEMAGSPGQDPDQERESEERLQLLHAAVSQLPEPLRTVFVQVELEHQAMATVAAAIGTSLATAYRYHSKAWERFRDYLC